MNTQGNVSAPCYCQPTVSFDYGQNMGSISVTVGQRMQSSLIFPGGKKNAVVIEDVMLVIPFSRSVRTVNLTVNAGTCLFDEATKVAKWTIGKLGADKTPTLSGTIMLIPNSKTDEAPPIQMHWKVPMASVSGLAVASLHLTNEKYKPYKGVRTIAKSGKFQIRSI